MRSAQLTKTPIGTGPFKFVSYTPGDRMVLAKFDGYFEPGMPKVDGVELRIMPEMSIKIAALKAGDIDILWDLPLDQVKALSAESNLRVESVATASWDARGDEQHHPAVQRRAGPPRPSTWGWTSGTWSS